MSATLTRGLSPVRAVLGNGAVVLAQETGTTPAVTINASLLAGSVYEPDAMPGLAYLAARVLDRGTNRRPAELIAEELDDRGVGLKVSASRHTMTVSATCLVEDFPEVLSIVADVIRHPTFPSVELEKRRSEVLTALRQDEDNPAVRAMDGLMALLYGPGHPYGRPAKGTSESIEPIGRDALVAFHAEHFRPAVLSLAIVGGVLPEQAIVQAEAEFGSWTGTPAGAMVIPPPPVATTRRQLLIDMPGKSQTDIAYGFTTISRPDPRYYAYWLMNIVLGQFGLGGRLADNIRERQGMAYYAFSTFDPAVGDAPLVVRAGVDPGNVSRALDAIDTEVRQLGEQGPTVAELEESRQFLVGSIPRFFETNQSIASFLQTAEHFGLGLDYDQRLPAMLEGVTIDEVRAAAAEVLKPDVSAAAIAGPHGTAP